MGGAYYQGPERRGQNAGRRAEDREALMLAQQALATANEALHETRAHVRTCEEDNREIKRTLRAQDDVLGGIRDAIKFVKILIWIFGAVGAAAEVWHLVHDNPAQLVHQEVQHEMNRQP